jgi:hypothetical protein
MVRLSKPANSEGTRAAAGEVPHVEVEGRVLDERSQQQCRDAASDLVRLLDADENT